MFNSIAIEAEEGQEMLQHAPCALLRALADFVGIAGEHDADAVRELLMPLFKERQSYALAKLHREFSKSDQAKDLAAEVLESIA